MESEISPSCSTIHIDTDLLIATTDQKELPISLKAVALSQYFQQIGQAAERVEVKTGSSQSKMLVSNAIPVQMDSATLEPIVGFLNKYVKKEYDSSAKMRQFFIEFQSRSFELLIASSELGIPLLVNLFQEEIKNMIKNDSCETIRLKLNISQEDVSNLFPELPSEATENEEEEDKKSAHNGSDDDFEGSEGDSFVVVTEVNDRAKRPLAAHSAVHDDASSNCFYCKLPFTVLNRKHHCRKCLQIFCHTCSDRFEVLAEDVAQRSEQLIFGKLTLKKFWANLNNIYRGGAVRTCVLCAMDQYEAASVKQATTVFKLCSLTIPDLLKLQEVSFSFKVASEKCLSEIAKFQFHLPTHVWEEREKKILWANRWFLVGHSRFIVQLLRICDWSNGKDSSEALKLVVSKEQKTSCGSLHCDQCCHVSLQPSDAIQILAFSHPRVSPEVCSVAVEALKQATDEELFCYLPLLQHALSFEEAPISSSLFGLLLTQSVKNMEFCTYMYWGLELRSKSQNKFVGMRFSRLKEKFLLLLAQHSGSTDISRSLVSGNEFLDILNELCEDRSLDIDALRSNFKTKTKKHACFPLVVPIRPTFVAEEIDYLSVIRKNSAIRPMVIPFCRNTVPEKNSSVPCSLNELSRKPSLSSMDPAPTLSSSSSSSTPSSSTGLFSSFLRGRTSSQHKWNEIFTCAYKQEDMRIDHLIISIIRLMDIFLNQEGMKLPIITYSVLPTSSNDGFLEWIPRSKTIQDIEKEHKSIKNYLDNHNEHKTIGEVKRTFMESVAAYTIITLLLGVGDRHNENLMITEDGVLFHIDYHYVLGQDPKPLLTTKCHLLTEVVDIFGGEQTSVHQEFKDLTKRIYHCLRRHAPLFISMLLVIAESDPPIAGGLTGNAIEQELVQRFALGLSDEEAGDMLELWLETGKNSFKPRVAQYIHEIPRRLEVSAFTQGLNKGIETMYGIARGWFFDSNPPDS